MTAFGSQPAVVCRSPSERRIAMTASNSRHAILVYAALAIKTMALTAPAALLAKPVHVLGEDMVRSGTQLRQPDCTSAAPAARPPKHVRDPFEAMLLGVRSPTSLLVADTSNLPSSRLTRSLGDYHLTKRACI
jgi:hypothetical protein